MLQCLGVPGVGKTAFGSILEAILKFENKTLLSLSTDDFYLPFDERNKLRLEDPRYITRGPPGTIDFKLLKKVVYDVKNNSHEIKAPHFDKSAKEGFGDRTSFVDYDHVDVFLLEGWFSGSRYCEETDEFKE